MKGSVQGLVIWLTGLPGSGKTTLATRIAAQLRGEGARVEVLDGDEVRENLSADLSFSWKDRIVQVRRTGFVARLLARNGTVAIAALISPCREAREAQRRMVENDGVPFVEVHTECPIPKLIERDPKGMYEKALRGEIEHFTGISDPYEPPVAAEVTVHTGHETVDESCQRILDEIARRCGPISGLNGSGKRSA